jgi:hypothetical protein
MGEFDPKSFLVSILVAVLAGWSDRLVALETDPIVSVTYQAAWRLGFAGVVFILILLAKQAIDEFDDYFAMGIFALPAIITILLPWKQATLLMVFSFAILAVIERKALYHWAKGLAG